MIFLFIMEAEKYIEKPSVIASGVSRAAKAASRRERAAKGTTTSLHAANAGSVLNTTTATRNTSPRMPAKRTLKSKTDIATIVFS